MFRHKAVNTSTDLRSVAGRSNPGVTCFTADFLQPILMSVCSSVNSITCPQHGTDKVCFGDRRGEGRGGERRERE